MPDTKSGWLSLQGPPESARLVKAVLTPDALDLYTLKPGGRARSRAPAYARSDGSTASLAGVAHRSAAPHPVPASSEGLAHTWLFRPSGDAPPPSATEDTANDVPSAEARGAVLAAPVPEVAALMAQYVTLYVSRALAADVAAAELARRVGDYCLAVASFPSVVANGAALGAVLRLVSDLGSLHAQRAEQLKVAVARAQDTAQRRRHAAFAPTDVSGAAQPPMAGWSAKVQKLAQSGAPLPASLMLEPGFAEEFAAQVAAFHRRLWRFYSPLLDPALLFHTKHSSAAWRVVPLVADSTAPHFLAQTLLQHLLGGGTPLSVRARLGEKWLGVAAALQAAGDDVGATAVWAALTLTPVLRLAKIWDRVDPAAFGGYDEWRLQLFNLYKREDTPFLAKTSLLVNARGLGKTYAKEDCVPYLGDAVVKDGEVGDFALVARQLARIDNLTAGWSQFYHSERNDGAARAAVAENAAFQALFAAWAQQPVQVDAEALSLALEPRTLGLYRAQFESQALPLPLGGMLPVLFVSPARNFRLFPRRTLVMASMPKHPAGSAAPGAASAAAGSAGGPAGSAGGAAGASNAPGSVGSAAGSVGSATGAPSSAGTAATGAGTAATGRPRAALRRASSFPPAGPPSTGVSELDVDARELFGNTASAHILAKSVRDLLNVNTETIEAPGSALIFKAFVDDASDRRSSRTSSIIESLNRRSLPGRAVVVKSASVVRLVDALVLDARVFAGVDIVLDLPMHIETLLATYRSFCTPLELLGLLNARVKSARRAARLLGSVGGALGGVGVVPGQVWRQLWQQPSEDGDAADRTAQRIVHSIVQTLDTWQSDYFFDFTDDSAVMAAGLALVNTLHDELARGFPAELVAYARHVTGAVFCKRYTFCTARQHAPTWLVHVPDAPSKMPPIPPPDLAIDGGLNAVTQLVDELDSLARDAFSRITVADWMKVFEVLEQQVTTPLGLYEYRAGSAASEAEMPVQNVYSWLCGLVDLGTRGRVLDALPPPIAALLRLHCALVAYFGAQLAAPGLAQGVRVGRMAFVLTAVGVLRARMQYLKLASDLGPEQDQNLPSFVESALLAAIVLPEVRAYSQAWLQAGTIAAGGGAGGPNSGRETNSGQPPQPGQGYSGREGYSGQTNSGREGRTTAFGSGGSGTPHDSDPNLRTVYIPTVTVKQGPVTVCVGWIIERLLEIVCCIPNLSIDQPQQINFDKRRYAFNLVRNIATSAAGGGSAGSAGSASAGSEGSATSRDNGGAGGAASAAAGSAGAHTDASGTGAYSTPLHLIQNYAFLFGDAARTASIPPIVDRKAHKDSLSKAGRNKYRVFSDIIALELEKVRAEARMREKLERQLSAQPHAPLLSSQSFYGLPVSQSSTSLYSKRISRLIPSLSSADVSSYLEPPAEPSTARKMSTNRKSRLGGFFKSVRPLSVLGSAGSALGSAGAQVSAPQPQPHGLYSHANSSVSSVTSFAEDSAAAGAGAAGGGVPNNPGAGSGPNSLGSAHNGSSSTLSGTTDPTWLPDASIDLSRLPPTSDYSSDDWTPLLHADTSLLASIDLESPNYVVVTHRSGPKPETLTLRSGSPDSAQDWVAKLVAARDRRLLASSKVFGVPLGLLAERTGQAVPSVLTTLLAEIEDRGLDEVGVYRISGSLAAINGIKSWFDAGNTGVKSGDARWSDVNAIAGAIKLYLRELPEPLMTHSLLPEILAQVVPGGVDAAGFAAVLAKLPRANFATLERLTRHLRLVVDHSDVNKMNVQNIAIVFGVNFLPPAAMAQMGQMQALVTALVQQRDVLFPASAA